MSNPWEKRKVKVQYNHKGKSLGFDRLCCWFLFILNMMIKQEWNKFLTQQNCSVFYKLFILLLLYTTHNIYDSSKQKHTSIIGIYD